MDRLKGQQHRSTTQNNYYTIWKLFNKFFLRLDKKPPSWGERLTLFVGYLINCQKQSSTVKSYISAIKAVLKTNDIEINENEFLLTSLTRACRLNNDRVTTKLAVHKGVLFILLRRINSTYMSIGQPYLALLFTTMLSTMYYGLFRVGEVAANAANHAVLAKDVQIGTNKNKFLFILRTSKTHLEGNDPQQVKISSTKRNTKSADADKKIRLPCPYQLLRDYSNTRPPYQSDTDKFFVLSDGSPVKATLLRSCFREALEAEGFNVNLYCLHGIRAGHAQDLLKLGLSVESIKDLGRWKSNAFFKYLKNK